MLHIPNINRESDLSTKHLLFLWWHFWVYIMVYKNIKPSGKAFLIIKSDLRLLLRCVHGVSSHKQRHLGARPSLLVRDFPRWTVAGVKCQPSKPQLCTQFIHIIINTTLQFSSMKSYNIYYWLFSPLLVTLERKSSNQNWKIRHI